MLNKLFASLFVGVLLLGCTAPGVGQVDGFESKLVGNWRSFSDTHNTQLLQLHSDNTWSLSSSRGTWRVENITSSDWEKWGIETYGPIQKIVLDGWNDASADGPIEESETQIDFFWVIYNVNLEVYGEERQVQIKYGHSNWD